MADVSEAQRISGKLEGGAISEIQSVSTDPEGTVSEIEGVILEPKGTISLRPTLAAGDLSLVCNTSQVDKERAVQQLLENGKKRVSEEVTEQSEGNKQPQSFILGLCVDSQQHKDTEESQFVLPPVSIPGDSQFEASQFMNDPVSPRVNSSQDKISSPKLSSTARTHPSSMFSSVGASRRMPRALSSEQKESSVSDPFEFDSQSHNTPVQFLPRKQRQFQKNEAGGRGVQMAVASAEFEATEEAAEEERQTEESEAAAATAAVAANTPTTSLAGIDTSVVTVAKTGQVTGHCWEEERRLSVRTHSPTPAAITTVTSSAAATLQGKDVEMCDEVESVFNHHPAAIAPSIATVSQTLSDAGASECDILTPSTSATSVPHTTSVPAEFACSSTGHPMADGTLSLPITLSTPSPHAHPHLSTPSHPPNYHPPTAVVGPLPHCPTPPTPHATTSMSTLLPYTLHHPPFTSPTSCLTPLSLREHSASCRSSPAQRYAVRHVHTYRHEVEVRVISQEVYEGDRLLNDMSTVWQVECLSVSV